MAKLQKKGLTCDWLNGFAGHGLANEVILNEAGGLGRNLHWVLRAFGPCVDHLSFGIGICGQQVTSISGYFLSHYRLLSCLLWTFLSTTVPFWCCICLCSLHSFGVWPRQMRSMYGDDNMEGLFILQWLYIHHILTSLYESFPLCLLLPGKLI